MIRSFYSLALLTTTLAALPLNLAAAQGQISGIEKVIIKNRDGSTSEMSQDDYNARKKSAAQADAKDDGGSRSKKAMEKYRAERAAAAAAGQGAPQELYFNQDGSQSQTPTGSSMLVQFGAGPTTPAAQPTSVQQQAANAVALAQGQVPTAQGAIQTLSQMESGAAPATPPTDPAATAAAANPGAVPGVTPSSAPAPESKDDVQKPFARSLFYTNSELVQIRKLLNGQAVNLDLPAGASSGAVIPQVRTITLTGVLYKSPTDWLIWLNGQKLNPNNLFQEIYEIQVFKDSRVRLKWYDIGLDGVIDVTLRPHQKYDIVTGLLLPVPPEQ